MTEFEKLPDDIKPALGDTIGVGQMIKLCEHFYLYSLIPELTNHPENFKPWKFDGVSGMPEIFLKWFAGCDEDIITYHCALIHDLWYATGQEGDEEARSKADNDFHDDLISEAGMDPWLADIFLKAVETGGAGKFGLSFSWGFARADADAEMIPMNEVTFEEIRDGISGKVDPCPSLIISGEPDQGNCRLSVSCGVDGLLLCYKTTCPLSHLANLIYLKNGG